MVKYIKESLEEVRGDTMKIIKFLNDMLYKKIEGQYENKVFAIVIRSISCIAVLYYLFMSTILVINSQTLTGIGTFIGMFVYLVGVYLTYKVSVKYVYWIYVITELVMTFSGVIYFGWHMGFQYTILLLLLLTGFNVYLMLWQKVAIDVVYVVSFLVMYFYTYYKMPWVVMYNSTDIIVTIISNIHVMGSFCIAIYYFSSKNSEMSNYLMEYSKRLEKTAFFDNLTGLYNRGETMKFLEKTLSLIEEDKEKTMSVIICDIDLFKRVNDSYGHQGGDKVLVEISSILRDFAKGKGIVSRWGGEEFLIVLPGATGEKATKYANELLEEIRDTYINYNGYVVHVTMSFGVQQYGKGDTVDEMISRADKKLYKAKNTGRNRVIS